MIEDIVIYPDERLREVSKKVVEFGSNLKETLDNMYETMMDKSDHTIAKMMMEGTNKGLISLEELLNNYSGKDEKIVKLIQEVISLEHQNNEELKIFL